MDRFKKSAWADDKFSSNYLDKADIFIPERARMFDLMVGVANHHFGALGGLTVCDLGCGNGAATKALLNHADTITATLVDPSDSMLDGAKEQLSKFKNITYLKASFHDLLNKTSDPGQQDMFVSAQAIHHLETDERAMLFKLIYEKLSPGGMFINIDVAKPPTEELEAAYFSIWASQMQEIMDRHGVSGFRPEDVIAQYKSPESANRPDTLETQHGALKDAGFKGVECYFKSGIFVVYGGYRE